MVTSSATGGPRAEINVTPLIDVMLVLLVVFMLVAPATTRALGTGLPPPAGPNDAPSPVLVVTVEAEIFRLGDTPLTNAPTLETTLREKLAMRRDRTVLVRVAGEVRYARVMSALDAAHGAGAGRVGVVTSARP